LLCDVTAVSANSYLLYCLRRFLQLNMDIQMELLDTTDSAVSVTVSSVHGGNGTRELPCVCCWDLCTVQLDAALCVVACS
jgi:hypothetical protein